MTTEGQQVARDLLARAHEFNARIDDALRTALDRIARDDTLLPARAQDLPLRDVWAIAEATSRALAEAGWRSIPDDADNLLNALIAEHGPTRLITRIADLAVDFAERPELLAGTREPQSDAEDRIVRNMARQHPEDALAGIVDTWGATGTARKLDDLYDLDQFGRYERLLDAVRTVHGVLAVGDGPVVGVRRGELARTLAQGAGITSATESTEPTSQRPTPSSRTAQGLPSTLLRFAVKAIGAGQRLAEHAERFGTFGRSGDDFGPTDEFHNLRRELAGAVARWEHAYDAWQALPDDEPPS